MRPTLCAGELNSKQSIHKESFFPFPLNGAWDVAYDAAFSRDLLASWNETKFDFDGFKVLYTSSNETIGRNLVNFRHAFIRTLGLPSSSGGRGGFVYLTAGKAGSPSSAPSSTSRMPPSPSSRRRPKGGTSALSSARHLT
ncbi:hypothetical protein DL771_012426 [Monosporascus sp. 5C6A]|nr:hypothetical protein DL771_012426 [Monosporascus sp. 5C6A]